MWPTNYLVFFYVLLIDRAQDADWEEKVGCVINIINDTKKRIREIAVSHVLLRVRPLELEAVRQLPTLFSVLAIAEAGQEPFILHVQEVSVVTRHTTTVQELDHTRVGE